jgi:hypothetical protein
MKENLVKAPPTELRNKPKEKKKQSEQATGGRSRYRPRRKQIKSRNKED